MGIGVDDLESIALATERSNDMRTVLLCRDGADQQHLATVLAGAGLLDAIVVESRGNARRTKLLKTFRSARPWLAPIKALDVLALVLYGNWSEKLLAQRLAVSGYPAGIRRIDIGNANDPASVEILRELRPDVLVVLGTGILRRPVLEVATSYSLNVHNGRLPEYRNVYGDFWALANNDPEHVGSTIFHLDPGVDTGDIALAESIQMWPWRSLGAIKVANSRLRARLVVAAIEKARVGELPHIPQCNENARSWYPPTAAQLLRGLWQIRRNRRKATRSSVSPPTPTTPRLQIARPSLRRGGWDELEQWDIWHIVQIVRRIMRPPLPPS